MSMVQQAIEVGAPLHMVYERLAAFENYPRFMTGVAEVTPIDDQRTHWVMDVDGQRREFDARITELSYDERVAWATVDGPHLAESITVRPMGETRTQVVAQLEADAAFLMPGDRHGSQALKRRLKADLTAFKTLVETDRPGFRAASGIAIVGGASTKQLSGRSSTIFGSGMHPDPASPASVAARITGKARPGAGWGTSADMVEEQGRGGPAVLDESRGPGRRMPGAGQVSGGAAGTDRIGTAPMGGRTPETDAWGDGMINEEERGSAHDFYD
jgi:hypothetical protein